MRISDWSSDGCSSDLCDVEFCRDTGCTVLARRGGGEQDMAIVLCDRQYLGRHVFRQPVGQVRRIGQQNLGYALGLRRLLGNGPGLAAGDQHMNVSETGRASIRENVCPYV